MHIDVDGCGLRWHSKKLADRTDDEIVFRCPGFLGSGVEVG